MARARKKRISTKDFRLLLSFLADKSEGTVALAKRQIKEALTADPRLRAVALSVTEKDLKTRVETVLEEARFEQLEPQFRALFRRGANLDLERGAALLAATEYPELDFGAVTETLDRLAEEVDRGLAHEPARPTRSVQAMRRTLFETQRFRGNEANYYDPDNSYINKVLERKLGIPITLSLVYLLVGRRLNYPVHGVGLPGHFIVGHRIPRGVVHIDPYNHGRILRVKDCEVMVKRLGLPFRQKYLDPVANVQILSRMIVNLVNIYTDRGQPARAHALAQLFQWLE